MPNPLLRPLVNAWMAIIKKSHELKYQEFGKDADQCMRFFDGPYDWLYSGTGLRGGSGGQFTLSTTDYPKPSFRMTMNKAAEVVQLYGPAMYARNPHRQITLRQKADYPFDLIPDPQQQQMLAQQMQMQVRVKEVGSQLMQELLNYTPNELDLRLHCRRAIDESLITGMGLVWTEPFRPVGSPYQFVGSFYDTVDNLLVDPDAETIQEAKWIARRKVRPKWQISQEFGIPMDDLRGGVESTTMQAVMKSQGPEYDYFRAQGETNDLMVYFEVYSRMGMGHRMHRSLSEHLGATNLTADVLDEFGDYVRLIVCEDYAYPLNLPEYTFEEAEPEEVQQRLMWPTPFFLDPTDPWPVTYLAFHERPRKVWPMSHLKPGLGELTFMNWAYSFLADKVKNTSRDFIATLKSLDEEIKANVLGGGDLTLIEFEKVQGVRIDELVQFLQHPPFNKDVLEVTDRLMQLFEERVGLNELMYGQSRRQLRSAAEANVKSDAMRIRPDDMSECVEAWATKFARKEAIASYWHYKMEDVVPVLGQERAQLYAQTVMQMDVNQVIHELDIRVEAGSIRKPNRDKDLANVNQAIQVWGPVVQAYAQMTGDFGPLNFLAAQWEKVNDMEPRGIQFRPPPPPQPDEAAQMQMQMAQQEHQQKLQHKQEEHQVKLQQQAETSMLKSELDAAKEVQGMTLDQADHAQEMFQDQEKHDQELDQDQQKHLQDMLQARQQGNLDLFLKRKIATTAGQSSQNGD